MSLPVDFEALARAAKNASGGGYPAQISAADLQKNFIFAALDADPSLIDQSTGQGGHQQRKLKIPAVPTQGKKALTSESGALTWTDAMPTPPSTGTHILGAVNGELQWLATEEC
jgi:hypothetical protein